MSLVLSTCAGVALDAIFGESKGWHPLVAFGRMAERIEQRFNPAGGGWRSHGVSAWCLAVLPLTLLAWLLSQISGLGWAVEILALYAALGLKSLGEHAMPVAQALRLGDLRLARNGSAIWSAAIPHNWMLLGWPALAASRCWKTAATRCLPRCSGLLLPVRRVWCCTA